MPELNRNQFEGSQNGYNQPVLSGSRFEHLDPRLRPTTAFPKPMRPPNVYRTRAGEQGIRRGTNPNAMRQGDPNAGPLEITPELSEATGIPEGSYPVVDRSEETQKRMRAWPKTFPGPKMGMN